MRCLILILGCLLLVVSCAAPPDAADLVLRNGKIITVDDSQPTAQSVAIRADRLVAVGSDSQIEPFIGPETEVLELGGRLVVPGFIEGHGHFTSLGEAKMILDLTQASSWSEIVSMVAAAAQEAEPGAWILGRGWHQEKWNIVPQPSVDGLPTHTRLSQAAPRNPVLLGHASGHAAFVNQAALEAAGIARGTPDPAGGTIVRDARGNATGALREKAQLLVREVHEEELASRSAEETQAHFERTVELAAQDLLSKGITSFQDAGASFATIDQFKRLEAQDMLPLRLYVMVRFEDNPSMDAQLARYKIVAPGGFLTVRAIKRQIDGALGPHGAWLLEPYEDLPESTGLVLETPEDIAETARLALKHGFQLNTHAIGDRANREVLDIYEQAFSSLADSQDLRWRIEHAQHVHPDDVSRFAELGIIAAMQGVHCTSDAPWVLKRLGAGRAQSGAYLWRSFWDLGVIVTNGTDVPVEDADPIASFYASVTRKTADGSIFFGKQRMTRQEALRSYTLNNALAAFEENEKGSITPGKLADLAVLSQDILTIPEEQIPATRVAFTILGGKIVYRAE